MTPFELRINVERSCTPFDDIMLRIEVRQFGEIKAVTKRFPIDYFKSHFDLAMEESIRLMKKQINK